VVQGAGGGVWSGVGEQLDADVADGLPDVRGDEKGPGGARRVRLGLYVCVVAKAREFQA
jgi:hypothetical protein